MANNAQRMVGRALGEGSSNRLDYSGRRLRSIDQAPSSREAGLDFMYRANDAGPGSEEYSDLMALYQAGWDPQDLPSAEGGGIPRGIGETAAEMSNHSETARQYFSGPVHPLLHEIRLPDGRSLADAGPEAARTGLALAMADAPPHLRGVISQAMSEVDNANTSNLGITWETPDDNLTWEAPTAQEADPSGYTQWREGQSGYATGLQSLMIQARNSDSMFDGLSNTGGGGGTYDHYEAMQMAAVRSGNLQSLYLDSSGMHQGDAGANTFSD